MHNKDNPEYMAKESIDVLANELKHIDQSIRKMEKRLDDFMKEHGGINEVLGHHDEFIGEMKEKKIIEKVEAIETVIGVFKWVISVVGLASLGSIAAHIFK